MCSGCSGQFEDGRDDEPDDDGLAGDEVLSVFRSSTHDSGRFSGERFEAGQARVTLEGIDEYEVLVSVDRIVERRVVRSKCHVISAEEAVRGAQRSGVDDGRQERYWLASAKYYRTFSPVESGRADHERIVHKCLVWCSLAVTLLAGVALWLGAQ